MSNKYRSWNSEFKIFVYFENGNYYTPDNLYEHYAGEELFDWDNAEQYTDLKDKNGKEIYEGDICVQDDKWVKWSYDPKFPGASFNPIKMKGNKGKVTLSPECRIRSNLIVGNESSKYEIIGNTHENPELMEAV